MPKYPEGAYTDSEENEEWEKALLAEIEKTVLEVWSVAGKPQTVYIAVDGVVPMAKIRQQRVRRFKSSWLRSRVGGSRGDWDTNSITPGTKFMDKLGIMLKGLAKGRKWTVSGVDEEGEGEHKIMHWLRVEKVTGPVVVYGLDADLILLTMLVSEQKGLDMFLLREKQEFSKEISSTQLYQFLNISEFKMRLGLSGQEEVLNYIALMSLMGNDFLPHSLTHKLSDGGHECVIEVLYSLRKTGWLVGLDGKFKHDVLIQIFKKWSIDEEFRMLHMIRKKREQASRGVGKGMDVSEGLPLEWAVEKEFTEGSSKGELVAEWRDKYWNWIHPHWTEEHKDYICAEYLKGFQWILDYYQGISVNKSWMFPAWIPPLWSDLASYVKEVGAIDLEDVSPEPQEQLAMVLPLESWGLIRSNNLRRLPTLSPQMWPLNFGFFSLGRRWLWECEARIPVLTAGRLREILRTDV